MKPDHPPSLNINLKGAAGSSPSVFKKLIYFLLRLSLSLYQRKENAQISLQEGPSGHILREYAPLNQVLSMPLEAPGGPV